VADGADGSLADPFVLPLGGHNRSAALAEAVLVILTGDEVAAQGAAVETEGGSFRRRDGEENIRFGLRPEEVGLDFDRLLGDVAAQQELTSLDLTVVRRQL
jgi:hypothetical protein